MPKWAGGGEVGVVIDYRMSSYRYTTYQARGKSETHESTLQKRK